MEFRLACLKKNTTNHSHGYYYTRQEGLRPPPRCKEVYEPENHNIKYIKEIFKNCQLHKSQHNAARYQSSSVDITDGYERPRRAKLSVYLMRQKSNLVEKTSFFLHLFETYVYRVIPHMKYSKQFINTYTISLMIVYFFTLYGIKLSDYLSDSLAHSVKFVFKFMFHETVSSFRAIEENNFNYEFKLSVVLSSLGILVQLFLSVRKFHNDLTRLHRGEHFLALLLFKRKKETYSMKARKRDKATSAVISNSLHFSGYMVAHLVYGYLLLFLTIFFFVLLLKLVLLFPRISTGFAQLALPFLIMIFLKYLLVDWFMPRFVFMRSNSSKPQTQSSLLLSSSLQSSPSLLSSRKIYKLNMYYIVSYFNFFFDCFLGLTSCMSRLWLNNLVSVLTLARIDISMFNHESNRLIKRLDKAYLAYTSYVRMEHFYNNPIVNGFCDLLIDSLITSKKDKERIETTRRIDALVNRSVSSQRPATVSYANLQFMKSSSVIETSKRSDSSFYEKEEVVECLFRSGAAARRRPSRNEDFNYDSMLRLRSLMYLCMLLKRNPMLARVRFKNLNSLNKPVGRKENLHEAIKRIYKNYLRKEI
jgi:hypothetical protein